MQNQAIIGRILTIVGLIALLIFLFKIWTDNRDAGIFNPEYKEQVEQYRTQVSTNQDTLNRELKKEQQALIQDGIGIGNDALRSNNFEGSQVSIESLEFWGKPKFKDSPGVSNYGLTTMTFDPDHLFLGMPDIEVQLSPIRLYNDQKSVLENVGQFFRVNPPEPKPYKIYKKTVTTSEGKEIQAEMQLWLTEFTMTITARPDRRRRGQVDLSKEEKKTKKYPAYWYGRSETERLTAKDLTPEFKNNRYGNLKVWLRLNPNKSPWYFNNAIVKGKKAEMAIGAVYCAGLDKIPRDHKQNLISTSAQLGSELALYPAPEYAEDDRGLEERIFDYNQLAGTSISSVNDTSKNAIWNKDYFVKVYLKNFGTNKKLTWEEHDQLSYTFLMPILIEGTWEVHAPYEVIPEWKPLDPYSRKISLVPKWGLGEGGKFITYGLLLLAGLTALVIFFPGILTVFSLLRRK